jgi:adenylosuccinate lyase
VERVILPDVTVGIDYILERATWLVKNLVVYPENMMKNLEKTNGLIYSQKLLLELAKAGMARDDAYSLVQSAAMETWETGRPFKESVAKRKAITSKLTGGTFESVFSLKSFLKEVDAIYDRVL